MSKPAMSMFELAELVVAGHSMGSSPLALKFVREEGDYFWFHCRQSDNLELGIVGLCNIVALEYKTRPKLAEKALIAVLTSGFSDPAGLLQRVVTEIRSNHTINPLRFRGGEFEAFPNASRSAQAFTADLSRTHKSALRGTSLGAPGGFRWSDALMADMPDHQKLLTAVCAYVFSAAITFETNARGAAERSQVGGLIPERCEMSQQFREGVACLVQQSLFLRHVLVFMYLSPYRASDAPWIRVVVSLGRIIEESGVRVFRQIRDYFVIPRAPPLALSIFTLDMLAYKQAAQQAEKLGALTPFVRFLCKPNASYFWNGKFQHLVPFMRGYFKVVIPSMKVSAAFRNERLSKMGESWGEVVLSKAASANMKSQDLKERYEVEPTLRQALPLTAPRTRMTESDHSRARATQSERQSDRKQHTQV